MKAYIITQADVDRLLTMIDRNPRHGAEGGSSVVLDKAEERAHHDAHRFYNYQVRRWVDEIGR